MVWEHQGDPASQWEAMSSIAAKIGGFVRCTVGRLMNRPGLKGIVRGKAVKTTISDKASPCPLDRVLDTLEQALHDRRPFTIGGLVHHCDRGSQYVSIRSTERLAEAGIEPSVGSVGDCYDNALAETINGLFKAEVIHRCGPWHNLEAVEFATLEWVDWFNNRRLLEPIGNIPPTKAEAIYYAKLQAMPIAA